MPPRSPTDRTSTPVSSPSGFSTVDAARTFAGVANALYSSPRPERSSVPACSALNSAEACAPGSAPATRGTAPLSSRAAEGPVVTGSCAARFGIAAAIAWSTMALARGPSSLLIMTTTADRVCGTKVFLAMKPLTAPPCVNTVTPSRVPTDKPHP